ncbi:hypothetical protein AYO20_04851 [Fonsecaea nubica]|uniref:Uncharacterized protein n=1 Tax=Fonsecaea nubica TaxID=856822 RepID=A0A178D4C6_9EURO|nr:hypothetical protein AYO20_04851 [Fonsecaea nubica]OAL35945.1 hypothetical protein AYO20_04851 [Fonsecaea nubica]
MDQILGKLKKADPWPRQFGDVIQEKESSLVKKLREIKEKKSAFTSHLVSRASANGLSALDKHSFDAEITPLLSSALGSFASGVTKDPTSLALPIPVQFLGAEGQMFCDAMVALMKQSGALIITYDELAARPSHTSRLEEIRTSFDKDKGVGVGTIEAGKKVIGMEIERLLADDLHEVRDLQGITAEEEQKGRMLLSHGADHKEAVSKQTPGWGNIARDTEMAIEGLCFAGQGQAVKR